MRMESRVLKLKKFQERILERERVKGQKGIKSSWKSTTPTPGIDLENLLMDNIWPFWDKLGVTELEEIIHNSCVRGFHPFCRLRDYMYPFVLQEGVEVIDCRGERLKVVFYDRVAGLAFLEDGSCCDAYHCLSLVNSNWFTRRFLRI